ncbi:MAG: phage holin family protein [Candidatus Campbellbacteria bacterium]|nr:phage holin family protein [Candidatus Campbellbacteria bacterium]
MDRLLLKWLITALSLMLVSELLPGVEIDGFWVAVVSAFVLGIFNVTLKPILYVLTLPINILTLGLFSFVLNGFFFYFVAVFVSGFMVDGFWAAVFGAVIVSLLASTVELGSNSKGKNV